MGEQYLLLPIHPRWAIAILDRTKQWELRTRRPSVDRRDVVVLYATSPLRAVVGSFLVGDVVTDRPEVVWRHVRDRIGLTRAEFFDASGAAPVVHAIEVTRPKRVDPYTPRFRVGQGWRYLDGRIDSTHRSVIERVRRSRGN